MVNLDHFRKRLRCYIRLSCTKLLAFSIRPKIYACDFMVGCKRRDFGEDLYRLDAQGFLNTWDGKNLLGLPAAWVPVAPIIVGHPKAAAPAPAAPRKEPDVRWVG